MATEKRQTGYLFLLTGYVIFGFSFMFSKGILEMTTPFVMLGVRFALVTLLMGVILVVKKKRIPWRHPRFKELIALGLVQPFLYFVCESYGVKLLQTSFVGIILSLIPITSFGLGSLFLKERVSMSQIGFAILGISGVILTTLGEATGSFSLLGMLFILGSVVTASLFNVISRRSATQFDAYERTFVQFFVGFIMFVPLAIMDISKDITRWTTPVSTFSFWGGMIFLAAVSSVLAFLLINHAMTHVEVAKASIFANVTTIVSIFAGIVFLHESFGWVQALGTVVILVSVYGVNRPRQKVTQPTMLS